MPNLAELTDYYPQQQDNTLPVESVVPDADGIRRVIINAPAKAAPDGLPDVGNGVLEQPFSAGNSTVNKIVDRLTGMNGEERYQLWPEKVVREALSAAHDVATEGTVAPGLRREDFTDKPVPDGFTVANSPADSLIEKSQAMSALAGTGGIAGADASLGSSPFLRPALKYENKIYKAPVGGQHLDALPEHLADTFQKQAMSGEDISNFNFGFMNHKGQFLDREKALDYAIKEGLLDPHTGQYGALTSTLLADSSKPGTAIEAMAKTGGVDPKHFQSIEAAKFRLGQLQRDKASTKKAGEDVNSSDYMFYNTQIRALKNFITSKQYKFIPVEGDPFK